LHDNIERILIVRTDRIGDVILTIPMAAVLKRQYPHAGISMLIRRYTSELVKNSPDVDGILYVDDEEGPVSILRLVEAVKKGKFDAVFHTNPRFRIALVTFLAGIPLRVGTGYRWYSFLFNRKVYEHRKDAKFHELEYNLHLLRGLGIEADLNTVNPTIGVSDAARSRVETYLLERGVKEGESLVVLHPGSRGSARNWSPEKFAELAGRLSAHEGIRLVVTGGPGEEEIAQEVVNQAGPRALKIVNAFSLIEYAALVQRASLFVANSTGTLHIAAAVGTPVIGFYPQQAPLSAKRWGPYAAQRTLFTPRNQQADCTKCAGRPMTGRPAIKIGGNNAGPTNRCECMETIDAEEVYQAALALLSQGPTKTTDKNVGPTQTDKPASKIGGSSAIKTGGSSAIKTGGSNVGPKPTDRNVGPKPTDRNVGPTRVVMALCALFLITGSLGQQSGNLPAKKDTSMRSGDTVRAYSPDTLRKLINAAFGAGEYLKFDVNYGFISAGEAIMRISDTLYHSNRKCLKIDFAVNSKPFFDMVYKVRDRYQTILDVDGLFPWRFEQHIREGGYTRDFTAEFDQLQHVARTSEGEYRVPPYVHDIMSAFYFARTIDYTNFTAGQKVHLQNFYKDSTYELDVRFRGRQEIEVDAGKFRCLVVEPLAREGGLFKSDGRVYVWLTDDDRRMPVRVSSKIAIGSVDSDLKEFRGLNGPLRAKINND
jgi:lipopolysaccharide heptosyltransferase II